MIQQGRPSSVVSQFVLKYIRLEILPTNEISYANNSSSLIGQ